MTRHRLEPRLTLKGEEYWAIYDGDLEIGVVSPVRFGDPQEMFAGRRNGEVLGIYPQLQEAIDALAAAVVVRRDNVVSIAQYRRRS